MRKIIWLFISVFCFTPVVFGQAAPTVTRTDSSFSAERKFNTGTVLREIGYGAVGDCVLGFGGGIVGFAIDRAVNNHAPASKESMQLGDGLVGMVVGGVTGYSVGGSLGVYYGARADDWRPNLFCTMAAGAVGTTVGLALANATDGTHNFGQNLAVGVAICGNILFSSLYIHVLDDQLFPEHALKGKEKVVFFPSVSMQGSQTYLHLTVNF
ncbi:MAG: hypothetical protein LWX56_15320 [Ignavibacteria bacterium]|nr:hypothetical protein [Ignavibacteria bacterium]